MEAYTVGNIKVSPFKFESLQELVIDKDINEHATLYVKGVIHEDWGNSPVSDAMENDNVKCEDGEHIYFSGVLQSVDITVVEGVFYLEARAISHTIKLDTIKHRRAFQNNGNNYQDIVTSIIGDKGGIVKYHANPLPINKILVQYDETDWQFAKRLASHTQDVLLAVSTSDDPELHFGVEDESCVGEILTKNYCISKDFNLLRSRSNDDSPLSENSLTTFKVNTQDFSYGPFDVGDKVKLNDIVLFVRRAIFSLENNIMACSYTLSPKEALTAPKVFNNYITGLALKGTVLVVTGDDVQLSLDIDYTGTSQFFKYATDYSPESHTGWYVMPEVGDTVFLVFPTNDESDAHASSSMRQSATGKTGDPQTKYLRTPYGKEVKLNDQEVLITGKDDETFIKINENSGIDIYTLKSINIFADENLDINVTGNTTINTTGKTLINSTDDMTLNTEANLIMSAKDSIHMQCGAGGESIINMTPGEGIKTTSNTEINMFSLGMTKIQSVDEMAIISNNNMNISSDLALTESGKASVTISNVTNIIDMQLAGGITITTPMNLGLSGLMTTVTGIAACTVASILVNVTAAGALLAAGLLGTDIRGGTGSVKLNPIGVDIKGPLIKEN